jgi:hypothetical protein
MTLKREVKMTRNVDKLHLENLAKMDGQAKEDYKRGLRVLGIADPEAKASLRAAFKRLKPDSTDKELDIMVDGKAPRENKGYL